jgi:DNA-binding response OmpR family regulator
MSRHEPPVIDVTPSTVTFETLRVLVAEDDSDCRESMEEAVRFLGFSCATARDGVEAWEMHEAVPVDVILSDWAMPRMNGFALCQRLHAGAPNQPYTHFVFVTGNKDEEHVINGRKAGANDFIPKPVDLNQLRACLESANRIVTLRRAQEKGEPGR